MLTDRGIQPHVLLGFYSNMICVAWNGILSDYSLAVNDVLSPVIFSVYTNGLLARLVKALVGCQIGTYYVGALAYADDITLIVINIEYCSRAMSESRERLCPFILDLIRCQEWYGSDDEYILDRDGICTIIKFPAAD